ncbi:MAG: PQ-loop domain-containing transporter [archaeon]
MSRYSPAAHHQHIRKRIHTRFQEYPHPDKWVNLLDKLLIVIAVIAPLMNIPQVAKIFIGHNASGISLLSYACFTLFDIPWLIYGIVHKEKPIVLSYSFWLVTNILVVIGVVFYG